MLSLFVLTFTVFLVSCLVQVSIVRYAWWQRATPGALTLILLTTLEIALIILSALDMISLTHGLKTIIAVGAFLLLSVYSPIALIFTLQFSGRTHWLTVQTYALLAAQPIISLLILWTGHGRGLILDQAWYTLSQPALQDFAVYAGPWAIFDYFYGYCLIALSISLLLWDYREASTLYRRQIQFILLSSAVLIALDIFLTIASLPFPTFFIDALGITIAGIIAVYRALLLPHVGSCPHCQ